MTEPLVVFVHGIRSRSDSAFKEFFRSMAVEMPTWKREPFNYAWEQGIESGAIALASALTEFRQRYPERRIYIVAHSMGGLVSRLAPLDNPSLRVERLIMLATPNFGALSPAQQGIALQFLPQAFAIFPKMRAYCDLLNVVQIFKDHRARGTQLACEYFTLPGEYYHQHRSIVDKANFEAKRRLLAAPTLWQSLFESLPIRSNLGRPHDGIVESASVSLSPAEGVRNNEKQSSILSQSPQEKSYAHVVINGVEEIDHFSILSDERIISIVLDMLVCENLPTWVKENIGVIPIRTA